MKQILILLVCLSASLAEAKNIFVSQNGAGSANGSDAGDAYAESWVNSSANWGNGSSQINPGDTVHLVGIFTTTLTLQGNGVAGNPITIYFEPGANFTTACWPSTGAIALNGTSYIIIDGGSNGLIQSTNNGTSLATQQNSEGISGQGLFLFIKNLTITNLYRMNPVVVDQNRFGEAIDINGNSITVSNCTLSDGDCLLSYSGPQPGNGTESNIFLLNNRLLNFNHGIVMGVGNGNAPPQNCLLTNVVIAGNYLDHCDVWDNSFTNGNATHHLDGIIILNNTTDPTVVMNGVRIYGNTFDSHIGVHNTAAIFVDIANPPAQNVNWFIYNNLFYVTSNGWGNGFVTVGGSNVWVVNNTCMGNGAKGGQISVGGANVYAYNNIMYSPIGINLVGFTGNTNITATHTAVNDLFVLTNYFSGVWSDHNVIIGTQEVDSGLQLYCTDASVEQFVWNYNGAFHSLSQWQTFDANEWNWATPIWNTLHCDPHSSISMPLFMPGTLVPAANDNVARNTGTNLTWLGITNDFYGNPRPATGPWDIGAFIASTNINTNRAQISAPTNLQPAPPGTTSGNSTVTSAPGSPPAPASGNWTNVVNGLLAWWTLDDLSGTDASGAGHNGTLAGAPATVSSVASNGLSWSAASSQAMTFFAASTSASTFTVAMWVFPVSTGVNYQTLVYDTVKGDGLFLHGAALDMYAGSDNNSSVSLTAGAWSFVAAVVSAGSGTFYINGTSAGTFTYNYSPAYNVLATEAPGNPFGGTMDDVRIYNRALTIGEVTDLFNWRGQP